MAEQKNRHPRHTQPMTDITDMTDITEHPTLQGHWFRNDNGEWLINAAKPEHATIRQGSRVKVIVTRRDGTTSEQTGTVIAAPTRKPPGYYNGRYDNNIVTEHRSYYDEHALYDKVEEWDEEVIRMIRIRPDRTNRPEHKNPYKHPDYITFRNLIRKQPADYICVLQLPDCVGYAEVPDHRIPLARGGGHTRHNLQPACRPCNSRKHAKLPAEYEDEETF